MDNMKKWMQTWALVDGLLVIGLIMTITYLFFSRMLLPERSPVLDLWLNISTELIFTWLIVRIIERLTQLRETRTRNRLGASNDITNLYSMSKNLSPSFYDFNLNDLKNQLRRFKENFHYSEKYFNENQKSALSHTIASEEKLVENAQVYVDLSKEEKDLFIDITDAINMVNEKRRAIKEAFESQQQNSGDIKAMKNIPDFLAKLTEYEQAFSSSEISEITALYHQTSKQSKSITQPIMDIGVYTRQIDEYSLEWFHKLKSDFNIIRDRSMFDEKFVERCNNSIETNFSVYKNEKSKLPQSLPFPYFEHSFECIKKMLRPRLQFESDIVDLNEKVEKVRTILRQSE